MNCSSAPANNPLYAARDYALRVLAQRISRAEASLVVIVDDWLQDPDLPSFSAVWNQLLKDHGVADFAEWAAHRMPSGIRVTRAPALPSPPTGPAMAQPGQRPVWRTHLDIVLCSIVTTLAATATGIGLVSMLPDTVTRTAISTAVSMGAAWMADRWLCRALIQRDALSQEAFIAYRSELIEACRSALRSIHAQLQLWISHFESVTPPISMRGDAPSRKDFATQPWKDELVSTLLAESASAWGHIGKAGSGSGACSALQDAARQGMGAEFWWGQVSSQHASECRKLVIETIGTVCMDKLRENVVPLKRNNKMSKVFNFAFSPFSALVEILAKRPGRIARGLFKGFRYLGWQTPEAQWLRHASVLAKGSSLLLSVAPLIATALDVYVRVNTHRLARAQARRARQVRLALSEAIRSLPGRLSSQGLCPEAPGSAGSSTCKGSDHQCPCPKR